MRSRLIDGESERALDTRAPHLHLATELFGDPHAEVERRFYTFLFAKEPDELPSPSDANRETELAGWRQALLRGISSIEGGRQAEQRDSEEAAPQRAHLGQIEVLVRGRSAVFVAASQILDGARAKNFRSYWSECLLFALLQHDQLEYLAGQLAELGFDPSAEALDHLYDEWLAFRNVFWWSQLSATTYVPQTLVGLVRAELGTQHLFSDLEADFATYTARRRWRMEDDQARALANLQTYGAAVAVIGSLATIAALLNLTGILLAVSVFVIIASGIVAALFVRRRLPASEPSKTLTDLS